MTTENHKPNVVSAKLRVFLTVAAIFLLGYMCAELTSGYTFIPGKRGGFLLSGLPTLLIVISASGLFLAALLTIIDHYDKRPNEESYSLLRKRCLKSALYLFFAAPLVELLQGLLFVCGIDIFPHIHGLAENYTFYNPKFYVFIKYVEPITSNAGAIVLLFMAGTGLSVLINKLSSRQNRLVAALVGISFIALSVLVLAGATQHFLLGRVGVGGKMFIATQEPAKFNAVLLGHFICGGFFFTLGLFGIISVITNRLKSSKKSI